METFILVGVLANNIPDEISLDVSSVTQWLTYLMCLHPPFRKYFWHKANNKDLVVFSKFDVHSQ